MFPVNQILKASEDGTGGRHPSFGDVGSVTLPGFKRSLQRCSGLLLCVWRRKPPPSRQNGDGSTAGKIYPQTKRKPSDTRCRGLGALSCSDFVEVNRIMWLKCCARRVLHVQRVWDAAQQVLARQGVLYIQRHCLQHLWWYHGALLAGARHIMRMLCGIYRAPLLRQRRGCTPAYRHRGKSRGFQTAACQTRQRSCRQGRS